MTFLRLYKKLGKQPIKICKTKCHILLNGELKEIELKFSEGIPHFKLKENR